MSIKVLLADDNITAQRLGSKILTDAGYDVIAVSNGAAAVKKISTEKPQLLILDVYMPGYTGLEVCEKVKQDPATSAVPVILTATNMEPFNQADGSRVGADGFMIKPFEASDLVAVVQKYEAKIKPSDGPRTVKMAAVEEFKDASYEEWKSEAEEEQEQTASSPVRMEVPHEMAAAPALGIDDLAEHAPSPETPAFAIESPQPAVAEPHAFAVDNVPAFADSIIEPHAHAAPTPFELPSLGADQATAELPALETQGIPVNLGAPPAEFEPTSAAPLPSLEVATAAELETTLTQPPDISVSQDPGLVTDADEMSHFATGFGVQNPEEMPVGIAMPEMAAPVADLVAPPAIEEPAPQIRTEKIETYQEPAPVAETAPQAEEHASDVSFDMQRAFSVGASGAAAAPALATEPEPALEHPAATPAPIPEELVAQFAAELDQAHQERAAMGEPAPVAESQVTEAIMEAAKEIPASQMDEEKIAAAVNRALDKYKEGLRAELIATIVKELKG